MRHFRGVMQPCKPAPPTPPPQRGVDALAEPAGPNAWVLRLEHYPAAQGKATSLGRSSMFY